MPQSFVFRLRLKELEFHEIFQKYLGRMRSSFSPLSTLTNVHLVHCKFFINAFAPGFLIHPKPPFFSWWISHCYNIQRMRDWLTFDMCLFRAWQQLFCQCNTRKLQKWQYNLMYSMKFEARHIRFALLHIGWQRAFVTRDVLNLACSYSARWQRAISNRTTGKCAPMMSFLGKI